MLPYTHWGLECKNNHLKWDNVDLVELTNTYNTPLYVVSKSKLLDNLKELKEAITALPCELYYSYKTNCVPEILKIIHLHGIGAEVVSGYELWLALKLGVNPTQIIFNGCNKRDSELRTAIENEIKLIIVDSITELRTLIKIATYLKKEVSIGLRICPNVKPQKRTVSSLIGSRYSHFGLDLIGGEVKQATDILNKSTPLKLEALHMHLGTSISEIKGITPGVKNLLELTGKLKSSGFKIKYLDLGGGLGLPTSKEYRYWDYIKYYLLNKNIASPNPENCASIKEYGTWMEKTILHYTKKFSLTVPVILLEPGRILTGTTQILFLKVGNIKNRKINRTYAILDGGMLTISSMLGVEFHEIFVANKVHVLDKKKKYQLVGHVPSVSDIVCRNKILPELEIGDILAVMDTGAYFTSTATNFGHPKPPIVLVENGSHRVIRRRETFEDMLSRDSY